METAGFEARLKGINIAMNGLAALKVVQLLTTSLTPWTSHTIDILFVFIFEGQLDMKVS